MATEPTGEKEGVGGGAASLGHRRQLRRRVERRALLDPAWRVQGAEIELPSLVLRF